MTLRTASTTAASIAQPYRYPEEPMFGGDRVWLYTMYHGGLKFDVLPEVPYYYRLHDGNVSNPARRQRQSDYEGDVRRAREALERVQGRASPSTARPSQQPSSPAGRMMRSLHTFVISWPGFHDQAAMIEKSVGRDVSVLNSDAAAHQPHWLLQPREAFYSARSNTALELCCSDVIGLVCADVTSTDWSHLLGRR